MKDGNIWDLFHEPIYRDVSNLGFTIPDCVWTCVQSLITKFHLFKLLHIFKILKDDFGANLIIDKYAVTKFDLSNNVTTTKQGEGCVCHSVSLGNTNTVSTFHWEVTNK